VHDQIETTFSITGKVAHVTLIQLQVQTLSFSYLPVQRQLGRGIVQNGDPGAGRRQYRCLLPA
jgi:hypothetical protein